MNDVIPELLLIVGDGQELERSSHIDEPELEDVKSQRVPGTALRPGSRVPLDLLDDLWGTMARRSV
jgi:hypothetical protein